MPVHGFITLPDKLNCIALKSSAFSNSCHYGCFKVGLKCCKCFKSKGKNAVNVYISLRQRDCK